VTNVEIVRRLYGSWNDQDFEAGRGHLHPGIEWRPSGKFPGFDPVYRGHEGVRAFWVTMMEAWALFTIEIVQLIEHGDTVVTDVRFEVAGRGSGAPAELAFAHVWELEEGLVVRYSAHASLDEALAVAGIEQ
jgi:ketosteroid isomerase-like protein